MTTPPAPEHGVQPQLIDQLHEANERLHRAREHFEEAVDAEVNSLSQREIASREIKDAAEALEKVDEQIAQELKVK